MQIQPTNNINFGNKKIFKRVTRTANGKCIEGTTDKYSYFVYVEENPITKFIKHKLYVVNKLVGKGRENWVKSFLRFYKSDSDNKMVKEIRSQAK